MKPWSLRLRLATAGAIAIILAITAASFALATVFAAHVERRALAELSVQLDQLLAVLDHDETGHIRRVTSPADPRFGRVYGGLYWQVSEAGQILRSRSLWDYLLPLPVDVLPDGAEHVHVLTGPQGESLLAVERSVTLPVSRGGGEIRAAVAMAQDELAAARSDFLKNVAPYSIVLAAALIIAGWIQIAVGLRPLAMIGARVSDIRAGRSRRLGGDFPTEVRPLASEVDALLDAREQDVIRARRRAGDLAHGLKTPLQALLGEAGRLHDSGHKDSAANIEDIVQSMHRHVDRELARTRVAARAGESSANLAHTVAALLRVVSKTRSGAALDWKLIVDQDINVAADPNDLAEALGALLENAARHARGIVTIKATRLGSNIAIDIIDDGPGIPANRIDALMTRGAREDTRGSGLGLAITTEIAEALGGSLTLHPVQTGLMARFEIPASRTN